MNKTYDMGEYVDHPFNVLPTSDDGFLVFREIDDNRSHNSHTKITKFDSAGYISWFKLLDEYNVIKGFETREDEYVFLGYDRGLFIVKLNSLGEGAWSIDNITASKGDFSFARARARSVIKATSDNCYLVATWIDDISKDTRAQSVNIMKVTNNGEILWNKEYFSYIENFEFNDVFEVNDERYIIIGNSFTPERDTCVFFIDLNGVFLYKKEYSMADADLIFSVTDIDDGYIILGRDIWGSTPTFFLKIDEDGNKITDELYFERNNDFNYPIKTMGETGQYIVQIHYDPPNNGTYIMKVDNDGNIVWRITSDTLNKISGKLLQYIYACSDGGFFLYYYDNYNAYKKIYEVKVIKTDKLFNALWDINYKKTSSIDGSLFETKDGEYILIERNTELGLENNNVYYMRINNTYNTYNEIFIGTDHKDRYIDVNILSDGNITILSYNLGDEEINLKLTKITRKGKIIWEKTNNNLQNYGNIRNILVSKTNDDGYLIIVNNIYSIDTLRLDKNGDELRSNVYNVNIFAKIKITLDGGLIFGDYKTNSVGEIQLIIKKLSDYGNEIWVQSYELDNRIESIDETQDGFIIFGRESRYGDTNIWQHNITKLDQGGDIQWTILKESNGFYYDSLHVIDDGFLLLATDYTDEGERIIIQKNNESGEIIWSKTFGYYDNIENYFLNIQTMSDGGYLLSGLFKTNTDGDVYDSRINLFKMAQNGTMLWNSTIAEEVNFYHISIVEDQDRGILLTNSNPYDCSYLIKLDSSGNQLWVKYFPEKKSASIYETDSDDYVIAGVTSGGDRNDYLSMLKLGSDKCTIKVFSEIGNVTGSGEYIMGENVTFSVSSTIILKENNTRYMFTGWSSTSAGGYTGTNDSASMVVDNDVTEVAEWKTQYYLTVEAGEGGSVSPSSGWYDEGELVELSVEPPQGLLVRQVFKGWSGDIQSESETVSVVMDGARSVVAEWSTDYSQAYLVGGLFAVLIVGGGVVSLLRRRREEEARAVAERRERIIGLVKGSGDVVVLGDVAKGLSVSEREVRTVIEEEVSGGVLVGRFNNDGHKFITDEAIRRIVKDKLKDERGRK